MVKPFSDNFKFRMLWLKCKLYTPLSHGEIKILQLAQKGMILEQNRTERGTI